MDLLDCNIIKVQKHLTNSGVKNLNSFALTQSLKCMIVVWKTS